MRLRIKVKMLIIQWLLIISMIFFFLAFKVEFVIVDLGDENVYSIWKGSSKYM